MREGSEKPVRVLVVEDEPEILRLEQAILEEAGMEVTGVWGVGEGMKRLRGERYEVVVTDLYVTRGQEGVESIAALVREAGGTPVVVLSGWPVEEEEARAAGVRRVLRKPFGVEELVGVVEEVLGGRVPGGVSGAGEETSGAPMT